MLIGMGGLASALSLAKKGFKDIQVFENASDIGFVGAGIQLAPNLVRILTRLGCWEEIEAEATDVLETSIRGMDCPFTKINPVRTFTYSLRKMAPQTKSSHTSTCRISAKSMVTLTVLDIGHLLLVDYTNLVSKKPPSSSTLATSLRASTPSRHSRPSL